MTTQELKQRIAECLERELNHQVLNNLLRSCLKHIEELEGEVTHMRQRIHDLGPTVKDNQISQLQSQLRERDADCAVERLPLVEKQLELEAHWHSVFKQKSEELSASLEAREELICSLTKEKGNLLERLQKAEAALLELKDACWSDYRRWKLYLSKGDKLTEAEQRIFNAWEKAQEALQPKEAK